MFCGNCGKQIDPKNKFCPNCGAEVNRIDATDTVANISAETNVNPSHPVQPGVEPASEKRKA